MKNKLKDNMTWLEKSKKGVDYLNGLGIDYKKIEVGFGNYQDSYASGEVIAFPMRRTTENHLVSYFGIVINETKSEFIGGSKMGGLYPGFPSKECTHLLITETVIDAASILQHSEITDKYEVLALDYFDESWNEYLLAIRELPNLKHITFIESSKDDFIYEPLGFEDIMMIEKPNLKFSTVKLPHGENLQKFQKTHSIQDFHELIANREEYSYADGFDFKPDNRCFLARYKNIELVVDIEIDEEVFEVNNFHLKIIIGNQCFSEDINLFDNSLVEAFCDFVENETYVDTLEIEKAINLLKKSLEKYIPSAPSSPMTPSLLTK